jgi:serine protease
MRLETAQRGVLTGLMCLSVPLALAACGASIDGGAAPPSTVGAPGTAADAQVTAAASAAKATSVPLAMSLRMNTSSLEPDTSTDRFIVKYKTGTTERGSISAVQSKLDQLKSTFPARARYSRRLGVGADVVTIERKLNANEAKAFMRAIASDENVEYVEPDVVVQGGMVPNDPDYSKQWGLSGDGGIHPQGAWDMTKDLASW